MSDLEQVLANQQRAREALNEAMVEIQMRILDGHTTAAQRVVLTNRQMQLGRLRIETETENIRVIAANSAVAAAIAELDAATRDLVRVANRMKSATDIVSTADDVISFAAKVPPALKKISDAIG